MFNKLTALTKSRFIRSVIIVASGTAGAQAISMAFTPFITRIYGPEAFGLLGTFMAVVSVLTPMAALTYPIAIVLPKKDEEALQLIKLSIIIAIITSFLVTLIISFWGEFLASYFKAEQFSKYLWFLPLAMLFSACYDSLSQWLIRKKTFNVTAKVSILQSIITNSIKVGAGLAYPLGGTLILIQTTAQAISSSLLLIGAKSTFPADDTVNQVHRKSTLKHMAYKYRDFAVFRAPEVTINAASQSLPVIMLASLFGASSAGFYTLGRTVIGIPSTLIGTAVGDVFYPHISQAAQENVKLYPLVLKATLIMMGVGIIPFSILAMFGPSLFTIVFGENWATAGQYTRWLSIWMFFLFFNSPSVKVIPLINAQFFQLIFTSVTIILRLSAIGLAYYFYKSDISAVIAFSIVGAFSNIFLILFILKKCKQRDKFLLTK